MSLDEDATMLSPEEYAAAYPDDPAVEAMLASPDDDPFSAPMEGIEDGMVNDEIAQLMQTPQNPDGFKVEEIDQPQIAA